MSAKVISFLNDKGGCGKTLLSVQFAWWMSKRGEKCLFIDCDAQGSGTRFFLGGDIPSDVRLEGRGGACTYHMFVGRPFKPYVFSDCLDLLLSSKSLHTCVSQNDDYVYNFCDSIDEIKDGYDYIVIDSPPAYGPAFQASTLSSQVGGVVIPVIPEDSFIEGAKRVVDRIHRINKRSKAESNLLGLAVINYLNNPMRKVSKYYISELEDSFGDLVFSQHIHTSTDFKELPAVRQSIFDYSSPQSKAYKQMEGLFNEIYSRAKMNECAETKNQLEVC